MANLFIWSNNAQSTLSAPITAGALALSIQGGAGALFPNPGAGQQFSATLVDAATGLLTEIIYCTARSGDNFSTIVRGQEGTTPLAWLAGDLIANVLTAGQLASVVQTVTLGPNRIVTASGALTTTTADANGRIGLNRTSGVGVSNTTLPAGASPGQTYTYEDLAGNFNAFPLTVFAPGGMSIAGLSQYIMNVNRQSATFTYYGSNVWSVSS